MCLYRQAAALETGCRFSFIQVGETVLTGQVYVTGRTHIRGSNSADWDTSKHNSPGVRVDKSAATLSLQPPTKQPSSHSQ